MKIVFLTNYVYCSHLKNRIIEFKEHGYNVEVYGFERKNRNKVQSNDFTVNVLGIIEDSRYIDRVLKYIRQFRMVARKYGSKDVIYYLDGFDVALAFTPFNKKCRYIYEEADLVHTYKKYKSILEYFDRIIIKKSLLTVLTSEGFCNYHFGKSRLNNVIVIPNRLQPEIVKFPIMPKKEIDFRHIRFGFVGKPRFRSVFTLIEVICSNFENFTVEVYGGPVDKEFNTLAKYPNCHFHGFFSNPKDLPLIYNNIDVLISTYDVEFDNVRYAEPNKIYESMYFKIPIIVSSGTYISEKVKQMDIGYDLNPLDENEILSFVSKMDVNEYNRKIKALNAIDRKDCLNHNNSFFEALDRLL